MLNKNEEQKPNIKKTREELDKIAKNGIEICSLSVFIDKGAIAISCNSNSFVVVLASCAVGTDSKKTNEEITKILADAADKISEVFNVREYATERSASGLFKNV